MWKCIQQKCIDTLCRANRCNCNSCLGQYCFVTGPALSPFLVPGPEQQMTSECIRGNLSRCRAQPLGCASTLTTSDQNTRGHEAGFSCCWTRLWLLMLFSFSGFPWTPRLYEFGREQTNYFDSVLPKGRRIAGEEGLGLFTDVQNGLECCGLGHWLLPPQKKAECALFIFGRNKPKNMKKQYWQPQNERTVNAVYKTRVVRP